MYALNRVTFLCSGLFVYTSWYDQTEHNILKKCILTFLLIDMLREPKVMNTTKSIHS